MASADEHAHRAAAARPARGGGHSGDTAPATRPQPGEGRGVLLRAPAPRTVAGQVLAVRRLCRALVRRDLPAAVRFARRLPGAARQAACAGLATPTTERAAPPPPDDDVDRLGVRTATGRRRRSSSRGAALRTLARRRP